MTDPTFLLAWRVADEQARMVYRIATEHWAAWSAPGWDQARRASLSVSLNIVEGYSWGAGPRWRYHLRVANGSALETMFALRFLVDIGALPRAEARVLLPLSSRAKRLVWGLLKSTERQ